MVRRVKSSILFVCEGAKTESLYLRSIEKELNCADYIYPKGVVFKISPLELKASQAHDNNDWVRTARRRRRHITSYERLHEVEAEYRAIPIQYVREAQLEMEENSHEQGWAVFDKDGVNEEHIKSAYELASDPEKPTIRIAFSSISFENWILLHYERTLTAFRTSECKDEKEKPINCQALDPDTEEVIEGCRGEICIGGYMRSRGYSAGFGTKKRSIYEDIRPLEGNAYLNAGWQRYKLISENHEIPIYKLNPYTDVDNMMLQLRHGSFNRLYNKIGQTIEVDEISIRIGNNIHDLTIDFVNLRRVSYKLLPKHCFICDEEWRKIVDIGVNKIILPEEHLTINNIAPPLGSFIVIEINNSFIYTEVR